MTMTAPETPRRSPKMTAPHRGGPVRCGHGHANAARAFILRIANDYPWRIETYYHLLGQNWYGHIDKSNPRSKEKEKFRQNGTEKMQRLWPSQIVSWPQHSNSSSRLQQH